LLWQNADILRSTGDTFAHETESIWQRTSTLEPSLQASDTEILATFAGLRPGKQGSPRIELEERTARRVIVHSYGANGTGYQAGLGMGMEAVSLALPHLSKTLSNYDVVNLYAAEMSQGRANP
jgi:D-amino-acid oxidase